MSSRPGMGRWVERGKMNAFIASLLALWLGGALLFCLALCAAAAGPRPRPTGNIDGEEKGTPT